MYTAALEQAEQLALAADSVGYVSKPLLQFYSLSQAGRAIASSSSLSDWRLSGHGLSASLSTDDILDTKVRPVGGPATSFAGVARAVGSPGLSGPASIRELWAANPDLNELGAGIIESLPRAFAISLQPRVHLPDGLTHTTRRPIDGSERTQIPQKIWGWGVPVPGETAAEVQQYLAAYSSFREARPWGRTSASGGSLAFFEDADRVPRYESGDGCSTVNVGFPCAEWMTRDEIWNFEEQVISLIDPGARDEEWRRGLILPDVADGPSPHPLLLWWALMYALSILARYQPVEWRDSLDIDNSEQAHSLERLMDSARLAIPRQILFALTQS